MESNVRLYAFNYDEAKTYLWAMADFTIGWPGLFLQVIGAWFILTKLK